MAMIHGPITYLVGKMPDRDDPPFTFRLDRMASVRDSGIVGCPPEDWDLDTWIVRSFGILHEAGHEIVLRVLAPAVDRARAWLFHPHQKFEEDGDELLFHFQSSGLIELASHLFAWADELMIEGPDAFQDIVEKRIAAAQKMLRPDLS